ncbi:hypothetical protein C0995_009982 [Termitomyces sp. Mi166|nr:hypothetical protein C0995_009982 [Termitomyces sp. Mi166\
MSTYVLELPTALQAQQIMPKFHVSLLQLYLENNNALFPNRATPGPYDFGVAEDQEWFVDDLLGHRWMDKGHLKFETWWYYIKKEMLAVSSKLLDFVDVSPPLEFWQAAGLCGCLSTSRVLAKLPKFVVVGQQQTWKIFFANTSTAPPQCRAASTAETTKSEQSLWNRPVGPLDMQWAYDLRMPSEWNEVVASMVVKNWVASLQPTGEVYRQPMADKISEPLTIFVDGEAKSVSWLTASTISQPPVRCSGVWETPHGNH